MESQSWKAVEWTRLDMAAVGAMERNMEVDKEGLDGRLNWRREVV